MAAGALLLTVGLVLTEVAVAHHGEDSMLGKAGDAITAAADSATEKFKDSAD
ncbi:hypothetical protein ACFOOP_10735 [Marinicaulis aureus]|uniref:Entericidin n=1 Tax=Hyphococcus aureus TaxID=2666033 RepID=A0ABW1L082_9PROT